MIPARSSRYFLSLLTSMRAPEEDAGESQGPVDDPSEEQDVFPSDCHPDPQFQVANQDTGEVFDIRTYDIPSELFTAQSHLAKTDASPWDSFWKQRRQQNEELWKCCEAGDVAGLRGLISSSASLDVRDMHGWQAIHLAASDGHCECVEVLVGAGCSVEATTDAGYTAVALAAQHGHGRVLEAVRPVVTSWDHPTTVGETPLHLAARRGHVEVVTFLLESRANPRLRNNRGEFPVDVAMDMETREIFGQDDASCSSGMRYARNVFGHVLLHDSRADMVGRFLVGGTKPSRSVLVSSMSRASASPEVKRRKPAPFVSLKEGTVTQQVGPGSFQFISLLGKGSFGEVFKVSHRDTQQIFAMKTMLKKKICSRNKNLEKYAVTERNVLSYINHPFIVQLYYTFQTSTHLVLVLEFCPGGSLQAHIHREQKLQEPLARIYTTEVLLALAHLHERRILYRDLKPDNVVLDSRGHALLTDFGLSKEGVVDTAKSFCGSVAYLAPEMLRRKGHNHTVDLYGLGVLLFEMLVGKPPFYAPEREDLFQNIQHARLRVPSNVSQQAADLITKLMVRDPSHRLGARCTIDVQEHPFFEGIDVVALAKKEVTLIPNVGDRRKHSNKYELLAVPTPEVFDPRPTRQAVEVPGWEFTTPEKLDCNVGCNDFRYGTKVAEFRPTGIVA
mmetsp:Transcript_92781/g.248147  ORF Transcript_92781/g.248147 Transcript_92781/m.248147 type:complete len:673 (+) Transcript_92781:3-2021(+)